MIPGGELPSSNSSSGRNPLLNKKLFRPWKNRYVLATAFSTSSTFGHRGVGHGGSRSEGQAELVATRKLPSHLVGYYGH